VVAVGNNEYGLSNVSGWRGIQLPGESANEVLSSISIG